MVRRCSRANLILLSFFVEMLQGLGLGLKSCCQSFLPTIAPLEYFIDPLLEKTLLDCLQVGARQKDRHVTWYVYFVLTEVKGRVALTVLILSQGVMGLLSWLCVDPC